MNALQRLLYGLLSFSLVSPTSAKPEPNVPTVVVIGAGAAGIAAGFSLQKKGFKVIVLEARDRIGGRIYSAKDGDGVIDLGASWIHGMDGNPLVKLAKKYKVPIVETNYDSQVAYNYQGKRIDDDTLFKMEKMYVDFIKVISQKKRYHDESVYDAFKMYIKEKKLSRDEVHILRYMLKLYIEHEDAADIHDLNTDENYFQIYGGDINREDWHNEDDDDVERDDAVIPSGYIELFKPKADKLDIKLKQTVTEVDYRAEQIKVTTQDHTYRADYVVCTVPLGVLKRNIIKFKPRLPPYKRQAIKRLKMGLLNKIYLRFDTVFWPQNKEFFLYVPKKGYRYIDYMNLHFYSKAKALLIFTSATTGRQIEKLSDEKIIKEVRHRLNIIFKDKAKNAKLISYRITRWGEDPYSYGSYSYSPVYAYGNEYRHLARPVDKKLFFAGEATYESESGTVTGAYKSGIKAAKQIIKLNRQTKRKVRYLSNEKAPSIFDGLPKD